MTKKGTLLVVSGPSGVGKDTVVAQYLASHPNMVKSVSATTRAPREGERHGVNYYFLTEAEFTDRIEQGKLLEHATYNAHRYGTPREMVEQKLAEGRDVVLVIEVQGALQIMQSYPQAVFVFLMPPSEAELEARLRGRGTDDPEAVAKRLQTAAWEMQQAHLYDFILTNDDLDETVKTFGQIVAAGPYIARLRKEDDTL